MKKKYGLPDAAVAVYLICHMYLIKEMAGQTPSLFSAMVQFYIPLLFSFLSAVLIFSILKKKTQSADRFVLFLLGVSLSLFAAQKSGEGNTAAVIMLMVSFQLAALYFLLFIQSILTERQLNLEKISGLLAAFKWLTFLFIGANIANLFLEKVPKAVSSGFMLVHFSLTVCAGLAVVAWQQSKKENAEHKSFLKWMMIVPAIAFVPFILMYVLPYLVSGADQLERVAVFSLFALPYGYTRLLMSRQLFDFDFVISRFFYYSVLSILPAFVLAVMLHILTNEFIASFLVSLVTMAASFLVKEQFDFSMRSSLFQDRNNLVQGVEKLSNKLSSVMKTAELERKFLLETVNTLNPSIAFIAEKKAEGWFIRQKEGKGPFLLSEHQRYLMERDRDWSLLSYKQWLGIQLYERAGQKVYVWVGPKRNSLEWNISEKAWLLTAVPYARLVADNLQVVEGKMEELQLQATDRSPGTIRLLLAISEKERRHLAADLHDSVLQEQFVVQRKIEHIIRSNELPAALQKELKAVQADVKNTTRQIRETCQELRPVFLQDEGLRHTLEELFSTFKLSSVIDVQYDIDLPVNQRPEQDKELAVYRIVQELLHNAQKHSKATRLSISIWEERETLFLDYLDNGIGFNIHEVSEKGNQMGISGIKERVSMLSGDVIWMTVPKSGVQVQMTLPGWKE